MGTFNASIGLLSSNGEGLSADSGSRWRVAICCSTSVLSRFAYPDGFGYIVHGIFVGVTFDKAVKSSKKDDFVKCSRYGLRILRNAAYLQYAAMTKDDA